MSWDQISPLSLDLLLGCGILLLLAVDLILPRLGRGSANLSAAILVGVLAASFVLDTDGSALDGAYVGGAWPLLFKRLFLLAGLVATLGSAAHVERSYPTRQSEYYLLLLFSLLGMMLLPGTQDLILLLVCFELMSLPLVILAAFDKNDRVAGRQHTPEGALKFYLVGIASTAITLFGISLIFGMAQTTRLAGLAIADPTPLSTLGMMLVLAGLGFKIGMVPFHMWIPDTYQSSGTPFVSFLSVAPKLAGFAVLALLFLQGFGSWSADWVPLVAGLSLVTILVGNLLALSQTNVKRLLAYSGVSQVGYMLMAFACANDEGLGMLLFYGVGYTVTNMGAFLIVQALAAAGGDDSLESFDGLSRRSPGLALSMLLFLLSLAGIPFVVGFWGKLYVFLAAWHAGLGWLVVVGAVFAVVALFYYLQIARAMYINPAHDPKPIPLPHGLRLAIALCLVFVVGIGAWPNPVVVATSAAARQLFSIIEASAVALH